MPSHSEWIFKINGTESKGTVVVAVSLSSWTVGINLFWSFYLIETSHNGPNTRQFGNKWAMLDDQLWLFRDIFEQIWQNGESTHGIDRVTFIRFWLPPKSLHSILRNYQRCIFICWLRVLNFRTLHFRGKWHSIIWLLIYFHKYMKKTIPRL